MHKTVLMVVLSLAVAGCTEPTKDTPTPDQPAETLTLQGIVQDPGVVPIEGAIVTVRDTNLTYTTGIDGRFAFEGLEDTFYILDATAPTYSTTTQTYSPGDSGELLFVLAVTEVAPYSDTQGFHGIIECAAEYIIITPSCDTIVEFVADQGVPVPNGGSVTSDNARFDFGLDGGWQTLVLDVVFDISGQPGLEAMRATLLAPQEANQLTDYEPLGRFQDAESFTVRIEPGASYPDGVAPVDGNNTAFGVEVYGQGHGWHAICETTGDPSTCTLGIGGGIDVSFDVYVTAFYGEPAPEGWSFQA